MAAYVIFVREAPIHNQAEMDAYRKSGGGGDVRPKPLAVYGEMETIEGKSADGVVVLEFANMEDARTWYFSDAYQAAAKHRRAAADYRGFIVDGFDPKNIRF